MRHGHTSSTEIPEEAQLQRETLLELSGPQSTEDLNQKSIWNRNMSGVDRKGTWWVEAKSGQVQHFLQQRQEKGDFPGLVTWPSLEEIPGELSPLLKYGSVKSQVGWKQGNI